MTDETYDRIRAYLRRRCPVSPSLRELVGTILDAKLIVDEDVEIDEPVLAEEPDPPSVRVSPSDFDDLRRRVDAEGFRY